MKTIEEVRAILLRITFAPSCVDMDWDWDVCSVLGASRETNGWLIRTTFKRPDRDTGKITRGYGRWWYVSENETEGGLVKTCFAAAKMILDHELMESFKYKEVRLFDPHNSIEQLASLSNRK